MKNTLLKSILFLVLGLKWRMFEYSIQWNLSNTDTLGTKIIVLISEVSLFQGKNNMYLYKVGTRSSVLIKQVSFKRGSTVVN